MVLRRSQGFYPIVQWRNEVNNLISDIFNPAPWASETRSGGSSPSFPALNVWEDGDVLYVEAEVPGFKNDDLDISVVGSDLTIRGQSGERPREGVAYHRQERGFGAFAGERIYPLSKQQSGRAVLNLWYVDGRLWH